jgi:hypothetical protein
MRARHLTLSQATVLRVPCLPSPRPAPPPHSALPARVGMPHVPKRAKPCQTTPNTANARHHNENCKTNPSANLAHPLPPSPAPLQPAPVQLAAPPCNRMQPSAAGAKRTHPLRSPSRPSRRRGPLSDLPECSGMFHFAPPREFCKTNPLAKMAVARPLGFGAAPGVAVSRRRVRRVIFCSVRSQPVAARPLNMSLQCPLGVPYVLATSNPSLD